MVVFCPYKKSIGSRCFLTVFVLLFHLYSHEVVAQECDAEGMCDAHERCPVWKEEGECYRSKDYMKNHCPVSCKHSEAEFQALKKNVQSEQEGEECLDFHHRCPVWESLGECDENKMGLGRYCPKSCNTCPKTTDPVCADSHASCAFWAEKGECKNNPSYMLKGCQKSCGTCKVEKVEERQEQRTLKEGDILEWTETVGTRQEAVGAEKKNTLETIKQTKTYFESERVKNLQKSILEVCLNRHGQCSFWAALGECESNKAYMTTNCAPACRTCHLIDIAARCPPLKNPKPALRSGDLNKMFERIVETAPGNRTLTEEEKTQLVDSKIPSYSVLVKSRPSSEPSTEVSAIQDKSLPPWALVFENFLTDEECDDIIQLGYKYGYKRSEDVGGMKFDGSHEAKQSQGRTSENAWCQYGECRKLKVPNLVHNRIGNLLDIPANNSEDFQILRYEKDQFYKIHHDYIEHHRERHCGPRILTFFMYLSDVEKGGGTNFPQLDITVMPKKGRALLWPSVYDSDPMKKDGRLMHQALPVEDGVKYAVNGWIHMYDYVTPSLEGCT